MKTRFFKRKGFNVYRVEVNGRERDVRDIYVYEGERILFERR